MYRRLRYGCFVANERSEKGADTMKTTADTTTALDDSDIIFVCDGPLSQIDICASPLTFVEEDLAACSEAIEDLATVKTLSILWVL